MSQLVEVIEVRNTLGEGVLWNAQDQSVWWTDIQEKKLFRFHWETKELESYETPERLCSFGFIEGERRLIAAFESGLALYDYQEHTIKWLYRLDTGLAGIRFNDGRVDHQGRFWAGTMVEGESSSADARLYRVDANHQVSRQQDNITISNAICWSPDSTRFYFADSAPQTIYVYDFDAHSGAISKRRVFAETTADSYPDGAIVDNEGYLWCAHWGGGCVVRYAPDGKQSSTLKVPASQPTCVAFGGQDMDLLFVTSAREALSDEILAREPQAGNLFVFQLPVKGMPASHYIQTP
jgi:sugar lactone lactonase YvrE